MQHFHDKKLFILLFTYTTRSVDDVKHTHTDVHSKNDRRWCPDSVTWRFSENATFHLLGDYNNFLFLWNQRNEKLNTYILLVWYSSIFGRRKSVLVIGYGLCCTTDILLVIIFVLYSREEYTTGRIPKSVEQLERNLCMLQVLPTYVRKRMKLYLTVSHFLGYGSDHTTNSVRLEVICCFLWISFFAVYAQLIVANTTIYWTEDESEIGNRSCTMIICISHIGWAPQTPDPNLMGYLPNYKFATDYWKSLKNK